MKKIHLVLLISVISCKPIKIKTIDVELSTINGLRGKVKKLEVTSSRYQINEGGSEEVNSLKMNSTIHFNRNNRIIRQITNYPNLNSETNFYYSKGLLMSTVSEINGRIDNTEYKYNKRKELIERKKFQNDTLSSCFNYKYDSNGNPIHIRKTYFLNGIERMEEEHKKNYDYKNRTVTHFSIYSNREYNPNYSKTYYNKKGLEIKSENINSSNNNMNMSVKYEYDKWGNTVKQINLFKKDTTQVLNYKYVYDKKNNVTKVEKIREGKPISKINLKITYW